MEKLKDKSSKATNIFLASDPDREAILYITISTKEQKGKRVEFNEITSKAIKNATRNQEILI